MVRGLWLVGGYYALGCFGFVGLGCFVGWPGGFSFIYLMMVCLLGDLACDLFVVFLLLGDYCGFSWWFLLIVLCFMVGLFCARTWLGLLVERGFVDWF